MSIRAQPQLIMRILTGMSTSAFASTVPALTASSIAFYATAATVIPVLFIALAVQGTAYQTVLKTLDAADRRQTAVGLRSRRAAVFGLSYLLLAAIALGFLAILALATYAEVLAIYALYQGHASNSTALGVLTGVIVLVIATAAAPVLAFLGTLAGMTRRTIRVIQAERTRERANQDASTSREPGQTAAEE